MADIPADLSQAFRENRLNKAELGLMLFGRGIITEPQFQKIVEHNQFFPVRNEALKSIGGVGMDILRLSGAAAVGAKTAIGGGTLGEVADRILAARKPGFVPQKGEALPQFIGESLPIAALGGAAGLAAKAAIPASPIAQSFFAGAGTQGVLSALRQAEQEGKVSPGQLATEEAIGGLTAGAFPAIPAAGRAVAGTLKKITPPIVRQLTKVPPEATELLIKNPNLLKSFQGTPEAVEARVQGIVDVLRRARQGFGKAVGAVKAKLGIGQSDEEVLNKLLTGQMKVKPLGQIGQELNILEDITKNPQNIEGIKRQVLIDAASARSPAEQSVANRLIGKIEDWKDPTERLKSLVELKGQANAHSTFSTKELAPVLGEEQHGLKLLRNKIDDLIKLYPGTDKLLRINEKFSKVASVFDRLQAQLPRPGKAETTLERAFRAKSTTALLANNKDFMNDIAELEVLTGKKLIEPLFKELASVEFSMNIPRGGLPIPSTLAAGGATASFLTGRPLLGAGILSAISPKIVGKAIAGTVKTAGRVSPLGRLMERPELTVPATAGILERLMRQNEGQ